MRRVVSYIVFVLAFVASLIADSNLRITDVGLHGYSANISAVRLVVRNPSSQAQTVHLQISAGDGNLVSNTVTADVRLAADELRELELPVPVPIDQATYAADASIENNVFGRDTHRGGLRHNNLIVLMCADQSVCKAAQSQIEFSGTIEERADKNRQTVFEVVNDPRDHWWAYSVANTIVLAMPAIGFTATQRDALEGFLRSGGRLVLLEQEIADPSFLSAYRNGPALPQVERVSKGTLFRVSGLGSNQLGDVFAGPNLAAALQPDFASMSWSQMSWLIRRFGTSFDFPRLRWILIWLAVYTAIIGVLNFAVLRRLHRLDLGWISICGLALIFAAGFYFSSASRRPKSFRLDNLATYYLDSRSPLAAADYDLRVSAPDRRDVLVSVADPAVFTSSNLEEEQVNSQIWAEMNRQRARVLRAYDVRLGPPRRIELTMLKWSFRDLKLQGLREFPGTVHFVSPDRLRNETGQHFSEAVYVDNNSNLMYSLTTLAPGEEIRLDGLTPTRIRERNPQTVILQSPERGEPNLQQMVRIGGLPFALRGRMFVGLADRPELPVELSVPHQQTSHALIVVSLEQP